MRTAITIFTCFYILATLFSETSCKKNESVPLPDSTYSERIEALLIEKLSENDVPGVAVYSVNKTGDEAWLAVGSADMENNIPMLKDTKFRVASISKSFLAVVVMQLMEEGKLSLEDHFANYLPDSIVSLFPYGDQITITQLLSHTSGLYDFEDDEFVGILFSNPMHHWTPFELLQHSSSAVEAEFQIPGTSYSYSNTNYIILGLLVEELTNKSMQTNIRERILNPLNLENTFCGGLENVPQQNYAIGYMPTPDGNVMPITDELLPLYFEWAHGEIISTVYDLYIFFTALANNQLLQHQSSLQSMVDWSELSGNSYGLGISNYGEPGWGHDGSTAGFISFASINPETGSAAIFCYNKYSGQLFYDLFEGFQQLNE